LEGKTVAAQGMEVLEGALGLMLPTGRVAQALFTVSGLRGRRVQGEEEAHPSEMAQQGVHPLLARAPPPIQVEAAEEEE
jgi:hypothetical protein